jgi:hypothetical protein
MNTASMTKNSIMLMAAAALAFSVASCGGQNAAGNSGHVQEPDGTHLAASTGAPAAGTGGVPSCDAVVGKMGDMMREAMYSAVPENKQELADRMYHKVMEVMLISCNEDQWPEEVKTCIIDARNDKDMDECGDRGGEEFENRVRERMTPVMEEIMQEMAEEMGSTADDESDD